MKIIQINSSSLEYISLCIQLGNWLEMILKDCNFCAFLLFTISKSNHKSLILQQTNLRGGVTIFIRKIQIFLNFRNIWNMLPPPSQIKFKLFWIWEHIDGGRPPRTDIWKGLFRHIYIENGHIKCFCQAQLQSTSTSTSSWKLK